MTDETEPEAPPPYDFRPSGVVWVTVNGEHRTLRRPLMGEFRALRDAHHDADLRIVAKGQETRADQMALSEQISLHQARLIPSTRRRQRIHALGQIEDPEPIEADELAQLTEAEELGPPTEEDTAAFIGAQQATQVNLDAVDDFALQTWAQWVVDTFAKLGVAVSADQLDPALCTVAFTSGLIGHWRNVPPPRGR